MSILTVLTAIGRAQLAAAVANAQSFPSAKIVVGDGNGATYTPNENQTALVHQVWIGNASVARADDKVIFQAVIPPEIGGFVVREVGVLIGAADAEELFIVSQHPSTEKIAAPANGSGPLPVTIGFIASASEQAVLPIGSTDSLVLDLSRAPHITVDGLVTAPPGSPADGSLYAIGSAAAGVFVGKGGWLAERAGGAWIYKAPPEKSVIRLATNGTWYQRDGAGWVALDFNDPSVPWTALTGVPGEFPPEGHDHDDRYIKKAGDDVLGDLIFENSAALKMRPASGVWTDGVAGSAIDKIGGTFYVDNYDGDTIFRRAGHAETLRITQAGNVRGSALTAGNESTNNHVYIGAQGNIEICNGSYAPYIDFKFASGDDFKWRQIASADTMEIVVNDGGTLRYPFRFTKKGALALDTDWVGAANQVLTSQGDSTLPSRWRSVGDLMPALNYQMQWPSGNGGANWGYTVNAWNTVQLNILISNGIAGASAAGGVVTLPAGTYRAHYRCSISSGTAADFRLRDTTNNVTLGVAVNIGFQGAGVVEFALGTTANVALQVYPNGAQIYTDNLASGEPDAHAILYIERVK